MNANADACARQLLETVPQVMQYIRKQMRSLRSHGLSVPQLRTLYFVSHNERPSLSDVADFIGLTLPSMSRLVDGLVRKSLLTRAACPNDRRHIRLGITELGQTALDVVWKGTHTRLTKEVAALNPGDRTTIIAAMQTLRGLFDPEARGT
ncbi:MAG: putative MarR family transcriptional regulator [Phycisphaerales bacterium]|nr:putative MarR family transcriptional regulator [Phycisphaerales bacterium]